MSAVLALIKRDVKLAARSGGAWAFGLVFMIFFLALCALALGGQSSALKPLAIALVWLAVLFAAQLSMAQIFKDDMEDGSLAQFQLAGLSYFAVAGTKMMSFTLIYLGPLVLAVPLASALLGANMAVIGGLCASLIAGLPAVAAYITISGALLCGRNSGGFLAIILTAPLLIPTLIFGIAAAQGFADHAPTDVNSVISALTALEFRILTGLSLISVAIGLPASAAALAANMES